MIFEKPSIGFIIIIWTKFNRPN